MTLSIEDSDSNIPDNYAWQEEHDKNKVKRLIFLDKIYKDFIEGNYKFNQIYSVDLQKIVLINLHEKHIFSQNQNNVPNLHFDEKKTDFSNLPAKLEKIVFAMDNSQYYGVLTGKKFTVENYIESQQKFTDIYGDKYDHLFQNY